MINSTVSLNLVLSAKDHDIGTTHEGLGTTQVNLPEFPNLTEDISLDSDFSSKRTTCFPLKNGARFAITNVKNSGLSTVSEEEVKSSCGIDEDDVLCQNLCAV